MHQLSDHPQPSLLPSTPRVRRATAWALVGSLLLVVLTGALLLIPEINDRVFGGAGATGALARAWLPGDVLTALLLGVAALGAVVAALGLARPAKRWVSTTTAVTAMIEIVTFAVLAQGMGTLSAFGYLTAFGVPVVLVVLGVQLFRTHRVARVPVVLAAIGAAVLAVMRRDVLATYVTTIAPSLAREAWHLLAVVLTILAALAWAAVLITRAAEAGSLLRATRWVTRHRVPLTMIAALGPLPYALARLTWLTPWPQFGGDVVKGNPGAVLQGLMLGSAAWLGVILTLGLIARWGEVFPRWFPGRGGRPVPPLFAIIPGGGVALMLCGAAIPLLLTGGTTGALFFPAWFWGPALALAVWGYAGHRAGVLEPQDPQRPVSASR